MEQAARNLGRRRALLFQAFACFAQTEAVRLGLDRLHFITREGHFYRRVHKALFNGTGGTGPAVDSVLVEASRQSTFGPSVPANGDLQRLWNLYPRMSPLAFLKSLNLDEGQCAPHFEHAGLPLGALVERPWSHAGFSAVLKDTGFRELLAAGLERNRELAKAYFTPLFDGRERVGLVEIGWQGSIQDNLALLFPQVEFHGFYLGLARAKNPPVRNSTKRAFGPDRNRSPEARHLLDAVNVLEFICLAPGGSVMRYERNAAGEVIAAKSHNPGEDVLIERFSLPFQDGVIDVCTPDQATALLRELDSGSLRAGALDAWSKLLSEPDPALVECYFALKSNEEFGMGEYRDQSQTPGWGTILLAPVSRARRARLIRYLTYSQWAEGMRQRRDLPLLKRWVLYLFTKLAVAVKAIRHGRPLPGAG